MNDDSKTDPLSTRSMRRRARVRADLLRAARHVFAEHGYHDATIADITQQADVSVGAFYLHFRDKEEAYQTIIQEGMARLQADVIQAIAPDGQTTLEFLIRRLLQHSHAERDLFRLMFMSSSNPIRPQRRQQAIADTLTELFLASFAQGEIDSDVVPLQVRFMTGSLVQAIAWWIEHDDPSPAMMADHLLAFWQHGLPATFFQTLRWAPTGEAAPQSSQGAEA